MPDFIFNTKTDDLHVVKYVTYVQQDKKMSCWFASAEMLFRFRCSDDFKAYLEKSDGGKDALELYQKGKNIDTNEPSLEGNLQQWALLTKAFGMKEYIPLPKTLKELAAVIQKCGPLWCAGRFSPNGDGHIITVYGAVTRKTYKVTELVLFHDPAPFKDGGGPCLYMEYDDKEDTDNTKTFAKKLYNEHETNGESPIMWYPVNTM